MHLAPGDLAGALLRMLSRMPSQPPCMDGWMDTAEVLTMVIGWVATGLGWEGCPPHAGAAVRASWETFGGGGR